MDYTNVDDISEEIEEIKNQIDELLGSLNEKIRSKLKTNGGI